MLEAKVDASAMLTGLSPANHVFQSFHWNQTSLVVIVPSLRYINY